MNGRRGEMTALLKYTQYKRWYFYDSFEWLRWAGLNDWDIYIVLSAVRGPDAQAGFDKLKWFTTARTRACSLCANFGDVNYKGLTPEEVQKRDALLGKHSIKHGIHFRHHFAEATRTLIYYNLMPNDERYQYGFVDSPT